MRTTSQAQDRRSTHRAMLPVVMLALATVVSAVASLNVALPSIARDTHATQTQLSWVIDTYALVFAALLCPAARSVTGMGVAAPWSPVWSSSAAVRSPRWRSVTLPG